VTVNVSREGLLPKIRETTKKGRGGVGVGVRAGV